MIKVKVYVYSPDIPGSLVNFTLFTPGIGITLSQSLLPGENAAQCSAAVAIRTVPLFVPPGTHCCWVDRGGVD